jgi:hypothetical protein
VALRHGTELCSGNPELANLKLMLMDAHPTQDTR